MFVANKTRFIVVVAVLGGAAGAARGAFINNSTGLTNPERTITFDEATLNRFDRVTNQFAAVGLTITPYLYYDIILNDLPNIEGHRVGFASGDVVNPFVLRFSGAQTAAAFAVFANTSDLTFEARLGGAVVETANVRYTRLQENSFYGFTGITLDEIRVTQANPSGSFGVLVDNVQSGLIPAPPAAALGLLGAIAAARRRR